ncbi:Conserved_hypothetical protein [Hexamita inflata]|uniref:ARM repeat superfamily protein n=1 Tax=Hexamita inflata TaxID=28002 RepID=A0AA86TMV2_9EUKA|nr:Conserved hypothetical protein [Hexamita inflata]
MSALAEQIEIEPARQIFEKHSQTMDRGACHLAVLSVSTLLDADFNDKQTKYGFFNANCHVSLIKLIMRVHEFQPVTPPPVYQTLIQNIYKLLLNILQDKVGCLLTVSGLNTLRFNELVYDTDKFVGAICENKLQLIHILYQQSFEPNNYIKLQLMQKMLEQEVIARAIMQIQPDFPAKIIRFFRELTNQDDKASEQLFKFNIVSKETKPNLEISPEVLLTNEAALNCILALTKYKNWRPLVSENLQQIRNCLQYPSAVIYRPGVYIFFELIKAHDFKQQVLESLIQDVQKVQSYQDSKLQYKTYYKSISRICDLLSAKEPTVFLQAASFILASITELNSEDQVLKDSGVIKPITLLLSVDQDDNRQAACDIVCGVVEKVQEGDVDFLRADPELLNLQIAKDLGGCLQLIIQNLEKQMWALRRLRGEENPKFLKLLKDFKREQEISMQRGTLREDAQPPKPDTTKPIQDKEVDTETATLQLQLHIKMLFHLCFTHLLLLLHAKMLDNGYKKTQMYLKYFYFSANLRTHAYQNGLVKYYAIWQETPISEDFAMNIS